MAVDFILQQVNLPLTSKNLCDSAHEILKKPQKLYAALTNITFTRLTTTDHQIKTTLKEISPVITRIRYYIFPPSGSKLVIYVITTVTPLKAYWEKKNNNSPIA